MPLVSIRAYAKHRSVSHTAVEKAVRQGRIQTTPDGKIDVEQADHDWLRNTSPPISPPRSAPGEANPDGPRLGPSYSQSRAVRELYMARLAKLEYEERSGKLVSAEEVASEAFNHVRIVRDRLLTIPDRVAHLIAAESDPRKVHDILAAEIRDVLIELSTPSTYSANKSDVNQNTGQPDRL